MVDRTAYQRVDRRIDRVAGQRRRAEMASDRIENASHSRNPSAGECRLPLQIRPARLEDAEPLAALAARSFRDAFAAENFADDVDAYVTESFSIERLRAELLDNNNTFLLAVARKASAPDGYAKLRRGEPDPSVTGPDPIELHRLYVDRSATGSGVGAGLMRASLEAARRGGRKTLWLGVWEKNLRAIAFYERWGFEMAGEHVFRLGSDDKTDLIMQRAVAPQEGEATWHDISSLPC
jgi:ribosomal protein S18 acetylase RimI-like enzyme